MAPRTFFPLIWFFRYKTIENHGQVFLTLIFFRYFNPIITTGADSAQLINTVPFEYSHGYVPVWCAYLNKFQWMNYKILKHFFLFQTTKKSCKNFTTNSWLHSIQKLVGVVVFWAFAWFGPYLPSTS